MIEYIVIAGEYADASNVAAFPNRHDADVFVEGYNQLVPHELDKAYVEEVERYTEATDPLSHFRTVRLKERYLQLLSDMDGGNEGEGDQGTLDRINAELARR